MLRIHLETAWSLSLGTSSSGGRGRGRGGKREGCVGKLYIIILCKRRKDGKLACEGRFIPDCHFLLPKT